MNGGDAFRFSLVKLCVPRRSNLGHTVRGHPPSRNLPHNAVSLYPSGYLTELPLQEVTCQQTHGDIMLVK